MVRTLIYKSLSFVCSSFFVEILIMRKSINIVAVMDDGENMYVGLNGAYC